QIPRRLVSLARMRVEFPDRDCKADDQREASFLWRGLPAFVAIALADPPFHQAGRRGWRIRLPARLALSVCGHSSMVPRLFSSLARRRPRAQLDMRCIHSLASEEKRRGTIDE